MQRKKSRFWSFIWSFMPGAGHMYLGFMKMGLSLMIIFLTMAAIVGFTNIGALAVFPVALYFYSFFHANNLASLDEQSFRMVQDQYLFGLDGLDNMENLNSKLKGKKRSTVAAVLILIGVVMLWEAVFSLLCDIFGWDNTVLRTIYYFMRDDVPRFVIGIAIIWVGIIMIRGRQENAGSEKYDSTDEYVLPDRRSSGMNQSQQDSYMNQSQRDSYMNQNQQNSYMDQTQQQDSYMNQSQQDSYMNQTQQQDDYMNQNHQ